MTISTTFTTHFSQKGSGGTRGFLVLSNFPTQRLLGSGFIGFMGLGHKAATLVPFVTQGASMVQICPTGQNCSSSSSRSSLQYWYEFGPVQMNLICPGTRPSFEGHTPMHCDSQSWVDGNDGTWQSSGPLEVELRTVQTVPLWHSIGVPTPTLLLLQNWRLFWLTHLTFLSVSQTPHNWLYVNPITCRTRIEV